ncbi:PREDICTED: uncharacterized protein LOC104710508 isoform X1 [Camelina sativa]|uniref:Uncharacterized protein LOC104710508 isoform X1 n=1 Tax=Camelina sativa TaxID=90675 RepID=A0ABM0TF03_CAMSA|nr:PREDICTED: uncharacterized protein LOC104710508 isoform X1 [Camelina sativa]
MGCGVSRPETDEGGEEGGDLKIITRKGSIGKDSETADSFVSDKDLLEISSTHSKNSKTNGEQTSKEDETECKGEEEKGDELKVSPSSPSFRIYCVFPRDPNDDNDDLQRNKHISDENKEQKGKRQAAVGTKIRRRFNNVKKLLIPPNVPSSTANRG